MKHLFIALLIIGSVFTSCHLAAPTANAAHGEGMMENMDMAGGHGANDCNCNLYQSGSKFVKNIPSNGNFDDDLVQIIQIALFKYIQLPLNNHNNPPILRDYGDYYESQFFKNIHSVRQDK